MACGCNNSGNGYGNGWGGCGCNNTVQYAPSACNPNFPTTCTALGTGVIQRVVGENSAYCKYTVPTLASNSLLTYNASTGLVNWNDGSTSNPIYLGSNYGQILSAGNFVIGAGYSIVSLGTTNWNSIGVPVGVTPVVGTNFVATGVGSGSGTATQISTNQTSQSTVGSIQGTTPTGQLVAFTPNTSTETQFPVVSPSGTTTAWGTIENIVPNAGVVYRPGSSTGASGNVAQAYGTTDGQVLTWVASTNTPQFKNAVAPAAFIDAQAISLYYLSSTTIQVNFGNLVFNSFTSGVSPVQYSGTAGSPYSLNIYGTAGVGALDTGTASANTYYYVYAIYNPTNSLVNVVASSNSVQPSPSIINSGSGTNNYSYYRMIGMFITTSGNAISSGYNQQGRNVYLGQSAFVNVCTTVSTGSLIYYTGTVTFAPYSVVNKATLQFVSGASGTASYNIILSHNQASTSNQQSAQALTISGSEIFGSAGLYVPALVNASVSFDCLVPRINTPVYYNINTDSPAHTAISYLNITGYTLSIF